MRVYNFNSQGGDGHNKELKTRIAVGINTDRGRVQQLEVIVYVEGDVLDDDGELDA